MPSPSPAGQPTRHSTCRTAKCGPELFAFDDPVGVAALAILAAAVAVVTVSDHVPRAERRWCYPAAIVLAAVANTALAVVVAAGPDRQVGLIPLLAAALLGYGVHRRIRAAGRHRAPRR